MKVHMLKIADSLMIKFWVKNNALSVLTFPCTFVLIKCLVIQGRQNALHFAGCISLDIAVVSLIEDS